MHMLWEQLAPDGEDQLERIARLRELCCGEDEARSRKSSGAVAAATASPKRATKGTDSDVRLFHVLNAIQLDASVVDTRHSMGRAVVVSGSVAEPCERFFNTSTSSLRLMSAIPFDTYKSHAGTDAAAVHSFSSTDSMPYAQARGARWWYRAAWRSCTGRAVVVSGSVAELYERYYDAEFFEEDPLGDVVREDTQLRILTLDTLLRHLLQRVEALRSFDGQCSELEARVERAARLLRDIRESQAAASAKTSSLHTTCERLLAEEKELQTRLELLRGPLQYFTALEEISAQLGMHIVPVHNGAPAASGSGGIPPVGAEPVPTARIHPGTDAFVEALNRIDTCMRYLREHPEFRDSAAYLVKYGQLQLRALALVKNQVVDYLDQLQLRALALVKNRVVDYLDQLRTLALDKNQVVDLVQLRMLGLIKNQAVDCLDQAARLADGPVREGRLEMSPVYTKFRAISQRVAADVALIRRHPNADHLLIECEGAYLERRLNLLRPPVRAHLDAMHRQRELVGMIRFSSVYLIRIGQLEVQLFDDCMSGSSGSSAQQGDGGSGDSAPQRGDDGGENEGLYNMLLALCDEMYRYLRPRMLHANDIDELCEIIGVVREEIVEEHRGRHGERQARRIQTNPEHCTALRVKIYSFSGHMPRNDSRTETHACYLLQPNFESSALRRLESGGSQVPIETVLLKLVQDCQERPMSDNLMFNCVTPFPYVNFNFNLQLIHLAQRVIQRDVAQFRPREDGADLDYPAVLSRASAAAIAAYDTWYPPMRVGLLVLSKIYRVVDMGVFEDIAAETVRAVTAALVAAGRAVAAHASSLDGHLFLVKHLLTLREQLEPFDISFMRNDRKLNFSTTVSALRRLAQPSSGLALFRLSMQNVLIQTAKNSLPAVDEVEVDARQDMEEALREGCNALVACAADMAAEPLLAFLAKARVFRGRSGLAAPDGASDAVSAVGGTGVGQLRAQAFAQPARLRESLVAAAEALERSLPQILGSMRLYLGNPVTVGILLSPVLRIVLDSVSEVRMLLEELYEPQEATEIEPLLRRITNFADQETGGVAEAAQQELSDDIELVLEPDITPALASD
ncbi:hypothetical protein JKP88DRAFT_263614 [Tribonema minus]|uniref:Conserved oligomeric Golgi complex subunit 3 n=1 Tax=Tribonema minus TaxID=303371 RepID=A0A835YUG6_9STRA|nr:hypothetical protein JKP88DRAFT_263614 [Tribonema minus]